MESDEVPQNNGSEKIIFKSIKKRALRKRKLSQDDDEEKSRCTSQSDSEEDIHNKLEETKQLQKLRGRPVGVSAVGLALGHKVSLEDELTSKDPYKIKSGGMVNMKDLKSGKIKQVDDAYDTGIGTQFSAETNKRDEDEEMMKYIEDQLAKKKGEKNDNKDINDLGKYLTPEEAALQALPEHLRHTGAHKSEEMLSNQMLSGIPEVDLGIEAKIKNIEATEEAKMRLLWEKRNKQDGPSQFVPTNMAVNFIQHNRFNIDVDIPNKKRVTQGDKNESITFPEPSAPSHTQKKNKKDKGEKATDDYHYEKFKKQFRRY